MKFYSLFKAIYLRSTLIACALYFAACTSGRYLATEEITTPVPDGQATLLLYGCRYPDDIENIAILDREGDAFAIDIYAPSYKVLRGLPLAEAFKQAEQFVSCSFFYEQRQIKRILGPGGQTVGFEVRPLYSPVRFGFPDVLLVNYALEGNRITAYVKLDPRVEAFIRNEGPDRDSGRK